MRYFIRLNNRILGPFTSEQVKDLVLQYRLDVATLLVSFDRQQWHHLAEIAEFRSWLDDLQRPRQPMPSPTPRQPMPASPRQTVSAPPRPPVAPQPIRSKKRNRFQAIVAGLVIVGIILLIVIPTRKKSGGKAEPSKDTKPWWGTDGTQAVDVGDDSGNEEIVDSETPSSSNLQTAYLKNQAAVGLVTFVIANKNNETVWEESGTATAFAIGKNTFVTNAHVAFGLKSQMTDFFFEFVCPYILNEEAKRAGKSYQDYVSGLSKSQLERKVGDLKKFVKQEGWRVSSVYIRMNGTGKRCRVKQVQVHQKYNSNIQKQEEGIPNGNYDFAILTIEESVSHWFTIAGKDELFGLKPGEQVGFLGFPSEGLDPNSIQVDKPNAYFKQGMINRLHNGKGEASSPADNVALDIQLSSVGGASGSPIFNSRGKVIAILWGGPSYGVLGNARVSVGDFTYCTRMDQLKKDNMSAPVSCEVWCRSQL